jgi:hypothetical protein
LKSGQIETVIKLLEETRTDDKTKE